MDVRKYREFQYCCRTYSTSIFRFSNCTYYYLQKIGKPDEGTNAIYLKITSRMFITQILMNAIFISLVGKDIENFRQIFILFEAFVFFIGAIYSFKLYRQEYK